jgi:hypothetical protein
MPNYTPITKQTHANKHWQKFTSYHFAANTRIAPIVAAELGQAVRTLPMVFIKQGEHFILCALMGLEPDQNLYIAPDGRWLGGYVPAAFRGYPFSLQNNTLHIDEGSGLVSEDTSGQALFDTTGELTKPVQEVLNFLQQIEQNRTVTDRAVAALAGAGCITPWDLTLQDHKVDGCHRIDETRLNTLPDKDFLALRRAGSLMIAYGQVLSMTNVQIFGRLAAISEKLSPQPREFDDTLLDDGTIIG